MKLIIVRHGETVENANRTFQGHRHGTLSNEGIEQTKKLAERLRNERIDVIFSSDLKRAKDTTHEIARFHDAPIHYSDELRERGFGIFEGKPRQEYYNHVNESKYSRTEHRPQGGESFADLRIRAQSFLDRLYEKYRGKTVLVVSHGGFIKMVLGILLKKPIDEAIRINQENTCVNIIQVEENSEHKAHIINCIKHL